MDTPPSFQALPRGKHCLEAGDLGFLLPSCMGSPVVHAGVQLNSASFLRWSPHVSHLGSLLLSGGSLVSNGRDGQASPVTSSVGPKQLSSSVRSTQSSVQPGEMYQGGGFKEGYLPCVWRAEGEDPPSASNLPMLFQLMLPCLKRCSEFGAALQRVTSLGRCVERGSWRRRRREGAIPCKLLA